MGNEEFNRFLALARSGDDAATVTLLKAFEADVRMMVRHHLPKLMRRQFDSMDFVQEIWQSVFMGKANRADFVGPGHFRQYLVVVARNKVLEEYRHRTTKKVDLAREEPLTVKRGSQTAAREVAAPGPSPSQVMQADECWDRLISGGNTRFTQVMGLRRESLTFKEIAERVGLRERTVRRVIEEARKRLEGG